MVLSRGHKLVIGLALGAAIVAGGVSLFRRPDVTLGGELAYVKLIPEGVVRIYEVRSPFPEVVDRAERQLPRGGFSRTMRTRDVAVFDGPHNLVRIYNGSYVDIAPGDENQIPVPTTQPGQETTVVVLDEPNPAWLRFRDAVAR